MEEIRELYTLFMRVKKNEKKTEYRYNASKKNEINNKKEQGK